IRQQVLREAGPHQAGPAGPVGIDGQAVAFALHPYQPEVPPGCPDRKVAFVQKRHACAAFRGAIRYGRADESAADDQAVDNIPAHYRPCAAAVFARLPKRSKRKGSMSTAGVSEAASEATSEPIMGAAVSPKWALPKANRTEGKRGARSMMGR